VEEVPVLHDCLLPILHTKEGRDKFSKTEDLLRSVLPQYVLELEGMAEGAQVPFEKLLLLNTADVLLAGGTKGNARGSIEGCTTIIVTKEGGGILAHNEDGLPEAKGRCFMLHVNIPATDQFPKEQFTAFCYPGSLPGRCFGVHSGHLAWSLNSLSPVDVGPVGITHPFLSRLVAGRGLDAALLLAGQAANGCSLNVYDMAYKKASNVEVSRGKYNMVDIPIGSVYVHCNMYLRPGTEEMEDIHVKSSVSRHKVISDLLNGKEMVGKEQVLRMLSDTCDSCLPVYRDGSSPSDILVTVATGLVDLSNGKIQVYVGKPSLNEPVYEHFIAATSG